MRIDGRDLVPSAGASFVAVSKGCVSCGKDFQGEARAVLISRPTQFPEDAEHVELFSRSDLRILHRLCRAKSCAAFLDNPRLPRPQSGVVFEESVYRRGGMQFLDGPVIERPWPVRAPMFFGDARSSQMKRYLRNESWLRDYCPAMEERGLRCVGMWSGQDEIDAVHHYARLFAQETSRTSGIWMPYWFRDARLNGANRVAYLIRGAMQYHGAVMIDTLQYFTLAWVWVSPDWRRQGVLTDVWHHLESAHQGFKVLAPLSEAMQAFLKCEDPNGIHEVVEETGCTKGDYVPS